jgi:hypothetical protein
VDVHIDLYEPLIALWADRFNFTVMSSERTHNQGGAKFTFDQGLLHTFDLFGDRVVLDFTKIISISETTIDGMINFWEDQNKWIGLRQETHPDEGDEEENWK